MFFFNKWSPVDFYFKNFVLPQYYCLSLHCSVKAHVLETWPQLVALLKVAYGRDFRRWHLVGGHNMLKASVPISHFSLPSSMTWSLLLHSLSWYLHPCYSKQHSRLSMDRILWKLQAKRNLPQFVTGHTLRDLIADWRMTEKWFGVKVPFFLTAVDLSNSKFSSAFAKCSFLSLPPV